MFLIVYKILAQVKPSLNIIDGVNMISIKIRQHLTV